MRGLRVVFGLGALLATPLLAQNTVRWNDVMRSLDPLEGDPPTVKVWLDQRMAGWGDAIRVGFRVEEDAFVVVARVDSDGRLSVLFPAGRTRASEVKGGEDNFIRSNRLGGATFASSEYPGSTGYVFALASRTPMDLTRLRQNDFSAWITGIPRMTPAARYFGDPYRVVQRFARVVAYTDAAEFDYDLEYYSVDQPRYVTASSYCGGLYGAGLRSNWRGGWWNRGLMFNEYEGMTGFYGYGSNSWVTCDPFFDCLMPAIRLWWNGMPFFTNIASGAACGGFNNTQVATSNPGVPPVAPPLDSPPINPWAADSIGRPNVEKSPGEPGPNPNGPHIMMDRPAPVPGGWNDREDLSFSIPSRALRAMRDPNRTGNDATPINAPGATSSGPIPMPVRPTIESTSQPVIEWVRPPRSFDAPPRDPVDRLPSLNGRREALARGQDMPSRPNGRSDFGPPPRGGSAMFDREPGRNSAFVPNIRTSDGPVWNTGMSNGGMYSPPATFYGEGRPSSGPVYTGSGTPPTLTTGGTGSTGSATTGTSTPPAGSASSGTSGSSTGSEKKPQQ